MRNHIVLLAGLGSSIPILSPLFKKWIRKLKSRLEKEGVVGADTVIHQLSSDWFFEKPALEAILDDYENGTLGKVILAGHSNGARDILVMARAFYNIGIDVQYAACLDMTRNPRGAQAYGNIAFLDEFHAKLKKVKFHETFKKSDETYEYHKVDADHISMASEESVLDRMVTKISQVMAA